MSKLTPGKRGFDPHPRVRPLSDSELWAEVISHLPLVGSRVDRLYSPEGPLTRNDLIQSALLSFFRGAELYDPDAGFEFSTYATRWIDQGIYSAIEWSGPLVHVPRNTAKLARKVESGKVDASRFRKLKASCVEAALKIHRSSTFTGQTEMGEVDLEHIEARPEADPPDHLPANVVAALNSLDEHEQFILRGRFGFDGPVKLLRELGAELGVTKARAGQIEKQALGKLREYLGVDLGSVINE